MCCLVLFAHAQDHAVSPPSPLDIPQNGLIANVPFTEQSGTAANDTTGNGNNCTFGTGKNAPTWNGIGIFEGGSHIGGSVNQWCSFPAVLSAQARTVAVCAFLPTQVQMNALNGGIEDLFGELTYPTLLGPENRSGATLWLSTPPYGTERLYYQQSVGMGFGGYTSGTKDMSIGWNCFFYVFGSASDSPKTVDHLYRNGAEVSDYVVQQASASLVPASGAWYLGGGGYSNDLQFVGTFEHVLAWDRTLSADEVAGTWQTLQQEMIGRGVVFNPPGNTTSDSVAVCLGDSQTSGHVASAVSWCNDTMFSILPPQFSWQQINNGMQGTTCVEMLSGIPQEEALNWSPNSPHSVFMLYCGINDINIGELTPAEIWPTQLAACQLAKQAGYENRLIVTLPSWLGEDGTVESLNALIRANWKSCYTGVIDDATDPLLGAAGAYSNIIYFDQKSNASHLKTAGQGLLAGYALNNLLSLYGSTAAEPTETSAGAYTMMPADNNVKATNAGAVITLPDCLGYPPGHTRTITNSSAGTISAVAQNNEKVGGSATAVSLAGGATGLFQTQLVSPTAAGCTWRNASTGLTLKPALNPVISSQPETFKMTVTPADGSTVAEGSVALACNGVSAGSFPVSAGTASFSIDTAGIAAGTYACTASYADPAGNYGGSSATASVTLKDQTTKTTLPSYSGPVTTGETVTLTASITGQLTTPGAGTVKFSANGQTLGTVNVGANGQASLTLKANYPAGTYTVVANYSGATGFANSSGSQSYKIQ